MRLHLPCRLGLPEPTAGAIIVAEGAAGASGGYPSRAVLYFPKIPLCALTGFAVASAVACSSPSSAPAASPTLRTRSAPRLVSYAFAPQGAPAALYNAPSAPFAPSDPFTSELVSLAAEAARAQGRPPPVPDRRLFGVAQELARILPEDRSLPYTPIEFALNHYGVVEPTPTVLLAFFNLGEGGAAQPATGDLAQSFGHRLGHAMGKEFFRRLGVGLAPRGGGRHAAIIILQGSYIDLQPVPRALGRGETFKLRGTILPPYRDPEVVVTRHDGSVVEVKTRSKASKFESVIACTQRSGRLQVEVNAQAGQGPTVIANFPVWCDAYPPHEITWSEAGERVTSDGPGAEQLMVDLVNAERRGAGLSPLTVNAELAAVARRFSQEMMRRGVVAHTLEGAGNVEDRVRGAGIAFVEVAENLARSGDVEDAHRGLMNSPGHRANILHPRVEEIGVGIMKQNDDLFITQLFLRAPPPFVREEALRELQARIVEATKLTPSANLDFLAQEHVQALADGVSNEEATHATMQQMARSKTPFNRVNAVYAAATDLSAFDVKAVRPQGMTHFGLGAVQREHPELGPRTIYLVVLLAKAP